MKSVELTSLRTEFQITTNKTIRTHVSDKQSLIRKVQFSPDNKAKHIMDIGQQT